MSRGFRRSETGHVILEEASASLERYSLSKCISGKLNRLSRLRPQNVGSKNAKIDKPRGKNRTDWCKAIWHKILG